MSTFADRMKFLRERNRWSQKEFADQFTDYMKRNKNPEDRRKHRYTPQHISEWENGSLPRADTLINLAKFTGVTMDFLLGLVSDEGSKLNEEGLNPAERQLVQRLRQDLDQALFVYKAYGIEPPITAGLLGDGSSSEKADH